MSRTNSKGKTITSPKWKRGIDPI